LRFLARLLSRWKRAESKPSNSSGQDNFDGNRSSDDNSNFGGDKPDTSSDSDSDHSFGGGDSSSFGNGDSSPFGNGDSSRNSKESPSPTASAAPTNSKESPSPTASAAPTTQARPALPTTASGFSPPCVEHCVPDNDPRVFYSPSWSIVGQAPFFQTTHQTDVIGSWVSFTFNGSGIAVFGSVPASNATHAGPTAAYAIDAAEPFVTAEPMAAVPIPNQPLFSASMLSGGAHTVMINVTDVQSASPFSLDYFLVTPPLPNASVSAKAVASASSSVSASAVSDAASNLASSSSSSSSVAGGRTAGVGTTLGVLAGVLSAVIFILLCVLVFFFVILRRRRRRAEQSVGLQSSLFTRPESILLWSRAPSTHAPSYAFRTKTFSEKVHSII